MPLSRTLTQVLALTAVAGTLAACGSATASTESRVASSSAASASSASSSGAAPTETQAMVCDHEIKGKVKQVLQLPSVPKTSSTYANAVFTCTYDLPMGKLRLSVQHSPTEAAAMTYLTTRSAKLGATEPLLGLSAHAYGTGTGIVLVLKDNETLDVDATGLPEVFGNQGQKRVDLAYEIASDVLGCWTGDDGS